MMIYKLLATVGVFLVLLCGIQTRPLTTPDFVSDWMELDSRTRTPAMDRIEVYHGLGEVPIMVVVKGRAPSGANEDYVFHGIGIKPRDDDSRDPYAAITYVYNDLKVIVGAMSKGNHYAGFATYTANNAYWKGPSTGSTTTAAVQIMAWKASSLPDPDFHVTGIKVRAGCTIGTTCFIERNHGLHEYPSLVVVRTKLENATQLLDQYYSNAVGAGLMTHPNLQWRNNGYVIYGFDKNYIRIWMDSQSNAALFNGHDGSIFASGFKTGSIEILVWRTSSLQPTTTKYLQLASLPGEEFDQETSIDIPSDSNKIIVFLWAKATDGVNEGFCFPGSGSMSYFTTADTECSGRCNYGGLTYAYTNSTLRIWKPENIPSGNIIAIPTYFAGGHKVQKSNQAVAVAQIWILKDTTLNQACEVDNDCIDSNSICSDKICLCKDGFYEVENQCEKDLQCEDSVPILPDLEIRGRNNKVDESNTEDYIVDDSRLKHSWYSTTTVKGQFLMPDLGTRLEPNTCGSLSQVIVNGTPINQTTLTSTPYTLGVCYDNCSMGLDILVRQCDNGEIQYNLPSLEIPKTAYCFDSPELQGVDEFEDPPEISLFGQFEVNVHLEFETKPVTGQPEFNNYFPYLKFSCDNDTVFAVGLYFTTYWYIGKKLITGLGPSLSIEPLLESMLLERNIGLGFHMKCGIRVSRSHTGILSDLHTSPEKFYGIKVHTPNIVLDKGSNAIVKLQPTLPIGCMYSSLPLSVDLGCVQTLQMTYPKTDSCQSNNILSVSSTSGCGPRFKALKLNDKWDKDEVYEFNITTKDRNFADGHQFRLSMTMERKNHIIWRNYQIEDILIYVTHNSAYKYKLCYAHVDPHMQTGDLHKYEHQYEGFAILYRNFKFGIEVQMRTTRCNNGRATCACAVAVRGGGDVFLINLCGGLKYIDFTSCGDGGILDVRKRSSLKYQVFTPIGTYIDLTIRPHRNYFNLMNVDIYMAPKDLHHTEGLCGYFDNDATNDLKGRGTNGVTYKTTNKPRNFHPEFSEEWRLTKNDRNYLVLDPGYVPIWQEEGLDMFCFCEADLQTATCSASLYKDCPVSRYSVTKKLCDKHLSRKKRNPMAFHRERERRQVLVDRDVQHNELKRSARFVTEISEEQALAACASVINGSNTFKEFASRLKGIDINQAILECAFDVSAGNDPSWVEPHVESLTSVIAINNERDPEYVEAHPKEVLQFKQSSCLRNCSNNGFCNSDGECICNELFHGPDCSISENDDLNIDDIEGGGICDLVQNEECDCFHFQTINLLETFTCETMETKILSDGSNIIYSPVLEQGEYIDIFNGICCIHNDRNKRSLTTDGMFARIVSVSVSNNGITFGQGVTVFILDSECQEKTPSSEITLKHDWCFINGICVYGNTTDMSNRCNLCDPKQRRFTWTTLTECNIATEEADNRNLIIIVTLSGVLGVTVLILATMCIKHIKCSNRKPVPDADMYNSLEQMSMASNDPKPRDYDVLAKRHTQYQETL